MIINVNDAVKEMTQLESASSDIIFSDMYDAYQMLPAQVQNTFLTECSRILSNQGWLVFNLHRFPDDKPAFLEILRGLFPTVILSTTDKNIILMASNSQPEERSPNHHRIETMERGLLQRFSPLVPRLRPIDFQFQS